MKKQVVKNFDQWIFEAEAPIKKGSPQTQTPAGYEKSVFTGKLENPQEVLKGLNGGWKSLPNSDSVQTASLQLTGTGIASDKVEDFNDAIKAGKQNSVLVKSPVAFGNAEGSSFIVGFPFQQPDLMGEKSKDIILSKKYLLFSPFFESKPYLSSNPGVVSASEKPMNFRLIPIDKPSLVGLQALTWCMGFNNSTVAKKQLAAMAPDAKGMIEQIKKGLASLESISKLGKSNDSAVVISDGYNSLVSSSNFADVLYNNFASGSKKVSIDDIRNEFKSKAS